MADSDTIPSTITYDSLLNAGVIPRSQKSTIERAFEQLRRGKDKGEFHALEAMKGGRQVFESGGVGAALGIFHAQAKTGLDATIGTGAAASKIPVDGAVMVAGFIAGVMFADEPHGVGKTAMNASAAAAAVFMFRQANDFVTKMNIKKTGITPGGGAALPNGQAASLQPGVISKATFQGDHRSGRVVIGQNGRPMPVEDRIASLARRV